MASAQVDRLNLSSPPTPSGLAGRNAGAEHVASGSFSPTQDADLLREAALRSRRARKQLSLAESSQALDTPTQPTSDVATPSVPEEDIRMEDALAHTIAEEAPDAGVDAEDGEIFEESQSKSDNGNDAIKMDLSGETTSALADLGSNIPSLPQSREPLSISPEPPLDNIKLVRPSLNMTARDLDEAKRLILDLLGLGVTPEYLVDCGISAQCLAICFYEMNLRFPLNLDRSKISLPSFYNVDKHMKESISRDRAVRQRNRDRATQRPVDSPSQAPESPTPQVAALPDLDRSTSIHKQKRGSLPSPPISLPSKPVLPIPKKGEPPYNVESADQHRVDTQPSPTGPGAFKDQIDLAEDQKRMEMLARKAAIDSIKKRAAKSSPGLHTDDTTRLTQPGEAQDVESAIDAFLATVRINPASAPLELESNLEKGQYDEGQSGSGSGIDDVLPDYDSDAMVEDELDTRSTSVSDMDDGVISSPTSIFGNRGHLSPSNSLPAMPEPTSSPRVSAAPPSPRTRFQSLDSSVPSGSFTPPTVAVPIAARKSRPTASDFIDQTPPRPSSAFSEPSRAALLKRKRFFVDPQVWPKRLIIDLDSSDEEDGEEVEGGVEPGAGVASTSSSRASVERNMSGRPNVDRGRDMASQMLLEKELQIKAMMQKIKMRELKKRLGIASASGTPVLTTANIVPTSEGVTALPPASTVISPSGSSNAEATEMDATKQETVAGVTSILEIQQGPIPTETALSHVEVSGDNTLGFELETNVSKLDKGKGKAVELNATAEDFKGSITDVPAAAILEDIIRSGHDLQATEQNTSRTHFKTYRSPLAGFTGPNLQPPAPTDRQLPTIYWISSTPGRSRDVNRKLCQYEFPSGTCKDQACTDIHAKDLNVSDSDIRKTVAPIYPNAGPEGLATIVKRVQQSTNAAL